MNRSWLLFPFAAGLSGLVACGGEFTSNAPEVGAGGTVAGNGGGSSVQTTATGAGGVAGGNGATGGSGNGSGGSLPGTGGSGGIGQGVGGSAGSGGSSAGRAGAGAGGGSVVDASTPPVVDAAPDRITTVDAKADAGDATPDASDAAAGCTPGALQCDAVPSRRCQDDRQWHDYHCGPLMLADVTAIDISKFPGFSVQPLRCKTITVCSVAQNCIYYGEMLGSLESTDPMFYDGAALASAAAVKISLAGGAASQCGNPSVTIQAGESFIVVSGQQMKRIFLPVFSGTDFVFYVREDGATFKDPALTMLLQGPG